MTNYEVGDVIIKDITLSNKNTKYAIHRSGSAVTLHKVEKDGTHTQIVRVATKPNSHGAYSSQMYNFTPSSNF